MKSKTFFLIIVLLLSTITTISLWAQYQIKSSVIANGGAAIFNESNRIVSTVGQPLIGRTNSQVNNIKAGFWEQASKLITDVNLVDEILLPTEFHLYQNYPNPFNPSTKISWQSPVSSWQTLKVYDVLGNEVATIVNEYEPAGSYEVEFKSSVGSFQLASGIYFYQLLAGDFVSVKKMLLLK